MPHLVDYFNKQPHGSGSNHVVQCEVPKIAKLVNITPITRVYGTYNYSYWGL